MLKLGAHSVSIIGFGGRLIRRLVLTSLILQSKYYHPILRMQKLMSRKSSDGFQGHPGRMWYGWNLNLGLSNIHFFFSVLSSTKEEKVIKGGESVLQVPGNGRHWVSSLFLARNQLVTQTPAAAELLQIHQSPAKLP